jgi:DNA-binding transcriptional LysR family regulator
LIDLPPQLILAADDPFADKGDIAIEDLVDEPMVLLDLPLSSTYFLSLFHERGLRPYIAERVSNLSSLRSLVANGFGYGLLNISTKTNLAPDGQKLVFRQLVGEHRPMVFGLMRMKSDYSSRIVAAFAEHVSRRVAESGLPGMS